MKYIFVVIEIIFSLLVFEAIANNSKSSEAYVPIINYDRVWEYHKVREYFDRFEHCIFYMHFDGEEFRNDKKYSVFTFFGNEIYWTTNDVGIYNSDIKFIPNTQNYRFLIREEENRVYLYNNLTINDDYTASFQSGDEIILYDFNLNPTDKFHAMSLVYKHPDAYIYGEDELSEYEIIQLDYEIIEGQECMVQYLSEAPFGAFCIEGIGCVDYGILPIYNLLLYVSGTQDYYKLNRVYNTNGDLIYQREDFHVDIPSSVNTIMGDTNLSYINGILEVNDIGSIISARIYDLGGNITMSADGYNNVKLDTKELNPGTYIAKAGTHTLKIVVR